MSEKILVNITHFKVRMYKKLRDSALNGKRVKEDNDYIMKEHDLFWNYSSGLVDFSMLASKKGFKVTLMVILFINRDHPHLNKNKNSLPLEHFDD